MDATTDAQPILSPPPLPDIIQRYVNGESVRTLAEECAVSRQTIYNWIFSGVGDEHYEHTVSAVMIRRIADADQELETAACMFDLARAREKMKFTRMDFERRRPKLYGIKQDLNIDNQITVIVQRSTPQPVVIEASVKGDE